MNTKMVDTSKPCPVCGKPFDTEDRRSRASTRGATKHSGVPLMDHLRNKKDPEHQAEYRKRIP